MKQNFANLGTRTRESGRIFAAPTEWARKLLLILLGDTDLQANRHFKSNSLLSPDHFVSTDPFNWGTVDLDWGCQLQWFYSGEISATTGDRTRDGAASGVLPLPLD